MSLLAVIIPMFNEQANAERCIIAVTAVIQTRVPKARLFVVNDGSSDLTPSILERLSTLGLPFTYISHPQNKGYGAALVSGAQLALKHGYQFGLFMDSDLTNDPELIPVFAERLKKGDIDFLKASRYVKGGGMQGVPVYRQLFTIIGNRVASILFGMGIRDCTNGFHAVRLEILSKMQPKERGFPFLMEELCFLKSKKARGAEIPYTLTARSGPDGDSKFSYSFKTILTYLKYALRASTL